MLRADLAGFHGDAVRGADLRSAPSRFYLHGLLRSFDRTGEVFRIILRASQRRIISRLNVETSKKFRYLNLNLYIFKIHLTFYRTISYTIQLYLLCSTRPKSQKRERKGGREKKNTKRKEKLAVLGGIRSVSNAAERNEKRALAGPGPRWPSAPIPLRFRLF